MRSCIYCGKDLKDGEQCECAGARARRAAKEQQNKSGTNQSKTQSRNAGTTDAYGSGTKGSGTAAGGENRSYYRTGYTNTSKAKARWNRFKTKSEERKNRPKKHQTSVKEMFMSVWRFLKSPVDGILNPKGFSMPQMLILAAIQGAVVGIGVYFVATGASRSWFRALANLVGFGGSDGYRMLLNILTSALSGALSGIIFFCIYVGIFYLINRFIFRLRGTFANMAQKLVFTTVPWTVITAVGVLISFISTTTLMIFMLCGGLITLILSYEALNSEWSVYSRTKSLYSIIFGYFILFTLLCALLRISIIGG